MDAGFPVLVFAPVDGAGHRGTLPSGTPIGRGPSDWPVLLALDLHAGSGDWSEYKVVRLNFASLTAALFAQITPSVVAIPLWSRGADAIQMMQRLSYLGFAGPVEVHCPHLPNARMVMAELSQVSGDLQVRLVQARPPG